MGPARRTASLLQAVVAAIWLSSCGGQTDDRGPRAEAIDRDGADVSTSGPFEWVRARTSADGRRVTIDFVGGAEYDPSSFCTVRYEAAATETDEIVTVVVSGWSPAPPTSTSIPMACSMVGFPRTVSVSLSEPLGQRRLVNAATGEAHPVNVEPWTPPTSTTLAVGASSAP